MAKANKQAWLSKVDGTSKKLYYHQELEQYFNKSLRSVIEKPLDLPVVNKPKIYMEVPGHHPIELVAYYEEFRDSYANSDVQTKQWLVENVQPDWVVIDAGANIGCYTILLAQLAAQGHVYAFEPTITINKLQQNIDHNRVQNVTLMRIALGNKIGRHVDDIFRIYGKNPKPERQIYPFTTIDEFVQSNGLERIDCIKIDVDSFDFEVLQGAVKTLAFLNPFVIVELNHALFKRGQRNMQALEWLADQGYEECVVFKHENFLFKKGYRFCGRESQLLGLNLAFVGSQSVLAEQSSDYSSVPSVLPSLGDKISKVGFETGRFKKKRQETQMVNLLTNDELKKEIIKGIPGLKQALEEHDHVRSTSLLREYVYNHLVWSNDGINIKNICGGNIGRLEVPEVINFFEAKEIGVLCGGASLFLAKVLELFGYDTTTYNYGIPGTSTHVVTLVAFASEKGKEVIIQDATFNCTYLIKDTGENDFFHIIQRVLTGNTSDITLQKGNISAREICFSDNDEGLKYLQKYKESKILCEEPILIRTALSGTSVFYAHGDLDFHTSYMRRNGENVRQAISKALGKSTDDCSVFELFLFPIGRPCFRDHELNFQITNLLDKVQSLSRIHSPCCSFVLKEYFPEVAADFDPPDSEGWERQWHGYYQMTKTSTTKNRAKMAHIFSEDYYHNFVLEIFCFLSVLEEIGNKHINFFELGSGRAPWCLALAGVSRFNLVANPFPSYRALAVEAEPTHYQWSKEHLSKQNINAETVWGAIGSTPGCCRFMSNTDPAAHMGQAVRDDGNIVVPCYTIDLLRETFFFDRINLIHMDVQGMELEALKGAGDCLAKDLIDYIIIGTHGHKIEQKLKSLLSNTHDLVVELPTQGVLNIHGFKKQFKSLDDGVHLYRRKGLK